MPPDGFSSSLSSEVFTLKAQGGKTFHIHSSFLKKSAHFQNLITTDGSEPKERIISLEDWDGDTVGRFLEFLYTDNYEYPDPTQLEPGKTTGKEGAGPRRRSGGTVLDARHNEGGLNQNQPLAPLSQCLDPSLQREKKDVDGEVRLKKFELSGHDYDYGPVLLAHAKVYALAQYKGIFTLRALSLERLLMTLMSIDSIQTGWHYQITINIVELLRYVYSHTDPPKKSEEPMRKIVSQFAALNFRDLQTREMGELMGEGGDLVKDLMGKVCSMLVVSGGELREVDKSPSYRELAFAAFIFFSYLFLVLFFLRTLYPDYFKKKRGRG